MAQLREKGIRKGKNGIWKILEFRTISRTAYPETSFMSKLRPKTCVLVAIIFLAAGCITRSLDPNPLVGWNERPSQDPEKVDSAIRNDYQDYIQKLPAGERDHVLGSNINFLQDGTGRHAVRLSIPLSGRWWQHILIYDQRNRRVQTVKRFFGHYQS
jgi:hypothetical protein